jgi:hypothetical protein
MYGDRLTAATTSATTTAGTAMRETRLCADDVGGRDGGARGGDVDVIDGIGTTPCRPRTRARYRWRCAAAMATGGSRASTVAVRRVARS